MWTAYHALGNLCSLHALAHPDSLARGEWAALAVHWENEGLISIGAGDLLAVDKQLPLKPKTPVDPGLVDHAIGSCLSIASVLRANGNVLSHRRWIKAARALDTTAGGHDLELFKKRWDRLLFDYQLNPSA
jgi:hypothetical protein